MYENRGEVRRLKRSFLHILLGDFNPKNDSFVMINNPNRLSGYCQKWFPM